MTDTPTLPAYTPRRRRPTRRRAEELQTSVLRVVTAHPGINGAQVGRYLRADQPSFRSGDHRKALQALERLGQLSVAIGAHGAKTYTVTADSPSNPDLDLDQANRRSVGKRP